MSPELRKVLIVANLYHASPRIPRLVKRFPANGWESTIVTPRISEDAEKIFNAPPKDLESKGIKLLQTGETKNYEQAKAGNETGLVKAMLLAIPDKIDPEPTGRLRNFIDARYWQLYSTLKYPDPEKGWEGYALEAGRKALSEEKFDLIMSSSSPVVTHFVCRQLKKEFGVPWIAEYRDLWSQNHNQPLGPIMRAFQRRLERMTLREADALVTVTDPWAESLKRIFPSKPIYCLPIGFEPVDAADRPPLTQRFTITYTGQIYRGKQDPFKFLEALNELVTAGTVDRSRVEVRFYGPMDEPLQRYLREKGMEGFVHQNGVVGRQEALRRQRESQVLLMFNWEDKKQLGWMGLKLIEYLSTNRPIINSGGFPGSLTAQIIEDTDTGRTGFTKDELIRIISGYYEEFVRNGSIESKGKTAMIQRYNFDVIAANYTKVFSSVLK